jgi:hypothetical protein
MTSWGIEIRNIETFILIIVQKICLDVTAHSSQLRSPTFQMVPSPSDLPHPGFEPGTIGSKSQC